MELMSEKTLFVNQDVVFREEDDGSFLFHPETGDLKCLNQLGTVIWSLCDGSRTFKDIEREVGEQYPQTPQETIHDELSAFVQELIDIGYIGHQISEPLTTA